MKIQPPVIYYVKAASCNATIFIIFSANSAINVRKTTIICPKLFAKFVHEMQKTLLFFFILINAIPNHIM